MLLTLYISGGLILFILAYRLLEIRTGKNIIPEKVRDHLDIIVFKIWDSSKFFVLKKWNQLMQFIISIPYLLLKLGRKIFGKAYIKSEKMVEMVKGKGSLKNKGSASFFISAVNEHKKQLKR